MDGQISMALLNISNLVMTSETKKERDWLFYEIDFVVLYI